MNKGQILGSRFERSNGSNGGGSCLPNPIGSYCDFHTGTGIYGHDNIADILQSVHTLEMKLKIFEADKLIGEAEVYALDPPMCVAMAKFDPAAEYEATRHANVIDADYVGDRSDILRLEMADGSSMKSEAISIQDFPLLNEREVHVIGIYEPSFDQLFTEHPIFKAYWNKS